MNNELLCDKQPTKKDVTFQTLNELVCKWQELLRLQDWDIYIAFVDKDTLDRGQVASSTVYMLRKKAYLRFVHPDQFGEASLVPEDLEQSVVHELLHIPLNAMEVANETLHEQFVDQMANLLVGLHRGTTVSTTLQNDTQFEVVRMC